MRNSIILATILALVVIGWVASGQLDAVDTGPEPLKEPADLGAADAPQRVRVSALQAEPYEVALLVNGATEAERRVMLRAEVEGPVEALGPEKGTRVAEGQVLVRIAPRTRPAALAEAKALLKQKEGDYEASVTLNRQGHRSKTQLAADAADLEAARAAVDRAQTAIDQLEVKAPFDGILEQRPVEIGDYLAPGEAVAEVVDLDPLLIVAQVSERDVGRLSVGQPGSGRLATGQRVDGRIRYIAAAADAATRTFRVELEVDNPDYALPDGVTAELRLPLATVPAYKVTPAVLTLSKDGVLGVMAVEQGKARFTPVQILGQDVGGVWLAGLSDNPTIITVGQEFVADGQAVEAGPAAEASLSGDDAAAQENRS